MPFPPLITVQEITEPDQKTAVTQAILHSLPQWFSPPEDIDAKALVHREFPFFVAEAEGEPVGFLALKVHNAFTADVFNLGVLEAYHRQGIGHRLLEVALEHCRARGFQYLTVKTLDESAAYEPYERTRRFYRKEGFVPLEVFTTFWNEENPCLFLVKRVD